MSAPSASRRVVGPPPGEDLSNLRNRVVELFGRKLSRREFAREVTRLIGESMDAKAVAILGYDRRRERLVLLAERGLPNEARTALGGAGAQRTWDIPLRGLRNRRISVIESAHQNPFVPRALVDISPSSLTIAALPIYYEFKPAGVLLVFTDGSRAVPDGDIQALSQAMRVAARGLRESTQSGSQTASTEREEEIAAAAIAELGSDEPRRAAHTARPGDDREALAQIRRAETERHELVEARQTADALLARAQRLEQDLARTQADLERSAQTARALTTARHSLVRERDSLAAQVEDLERRRTDELAGLRSEVASLEDRLMAAESERVRFQRALDQSRTGAERSSKTLEAERDTLLERVRTAETTSAAAQAELATVRDDRDRLSGQVEGFLRQIQTNQSTLDETRAHLAQEVAALNADRDGWREQATTLQAQIAQRVQEQRGMEHEVRTLAGARDAATHQLAAARAEVERLNAARDELANSASHAEALRAAAAAEAASLRKTIEDERAHTARLQEQFARDSSARQTELGQLTASITALQGDLAARERIVAERDQQLSELLRHREGVRGAEERWEQTSAALRAEIADLQQRLAESGAAQARLESERTLAKQQLDELLSTRGNTERKLAEDLQTARLEIARLGQQRDQLATTAEQARATATAAEAASSELRALLTAEAERIRHQLETLETERSSLAHRLEHAQQAAAAESERAEGELRRAAAASQRCTALEASLSEGETKRAELEGILAQTQAQLATLREQSADRGALARQATDLQGRAIELQKLLETAQSEAVAVRAQLAEVERQRIALAKGLQSAHREHAQQQAAIEQENERLKASLQRASEDLKRLTQEQTEHVGAIEAQRAAHAVALAELQAAVEGARADRERAIAERDQHASAAAAAMIAANEASALAAQGGQSTSHRLTEKQRRIDELTELLRQKDAMLEAAQAERRSVEGALQDLEASTSEIQRECEDLRQQLFAASDRIEQIQHEQDEKVELMQRDFSTQLESARRSAEERESRARVATQLALDEKRTARYEAPLVIERSAPLGTVVKTEVRAEEGAGSDGNEAPMPKGEVLLLDEGPLCEEALAALKEGGVEATAAAATEIAIDKAVRRKVACVAINLASGATAWHTLKTLRERPATRTVPLFAYLMTPDLPCGFTFGRADFGIWPMDPTRLVERLGQLKPKLRRVLVVSSDIEGMRGLRELLQKQRVAMSLALDARQARDLTSTVQPEAAVMHLSPNCPDIARAIAAFRNSDATRELPLLLLIDKGTSTREDTFLAAATRELLRNGTFEFSALRNDIATTCA